jgi:hypothetical protein
MKSKSFRELTVWSLAFLLASAPIAANAAAYPPSIQPPKVGQPIQNSATPLEAGFTAVIPIATSTIIPTIVGTPISLEKASPIIGAARTLNAAAFNKAPVKLNTGLIIGGVPSYKVARTPLVKVEAGKKQEIQTATDVPTRISITGLKKSKTAAVSLLVSYSSKISLFNVRISSKGVITLPPITVQDKALPISLQIVVGTSTYTFPLRAIK